VKNYDQKKMLKKIGTSWIARQIGHVLCILGASLFGSTILQIFADDRKISEVVLMDVTTYFLLVSVTL